MEYIKYTREEIKLLMDTLGPYPYNKVKHLSMACIQACNDIENPAQSFRSSYIYRPVQRKVIFQETLDNMPLYINDKSTTMRIIANWRLSIAK